MIDTRRILDLMADAVLVADDDRRYVDANAAAAALFGVPRAELLGRRIDDFAPPPPELDVEAAWQAFLRDGYQEGTFPLQRPDGTHRFVEFRARTNLAPGQHLSVLRDVTERIEREREFVKLADNLPYVVTRFSRERRHLYVNQAITAYTGLQPAAVIGKTNAELGMAPALVATWDRAIDAALRGEPTALTFDWPMTDGPHQFEARLVPETAADGVIATVLGITRDVTVELRARERMRLATEATGVGIWEWNVLTGKVAWDAQMFAIYGLPAFPDGIATYETWSTAVLPEDLSRQEEVLQDTVRRAGHSTRRFRIRRASDGQVRHVVSVETTRANAQGEIEWVVGTNLDVTERTQAEDALRDSEARFRAIADNVPQLAWMANSSGELDWFNRGWLAYTGTRLEDNVGDGWKRVHHPDHIERVARKFEQHLREGQDWEDTFPLRGKDGHYRWFLSRMNVIRDDAGRGVRFFGTNTDVTEQRRMADDLQRLTEELRVTDLRKDEFLATLAHELRNPLAPIRTGLSVVRAARSPDEAARALAMMERQLGHLINLVDDLLDLSRVRSGKITLRAEPQQLREVIDDAVEACRPSIDAMDHALEVRVAEPLIVHGDKTRLVQVIANLLTNAAKYSERGGRIIVTVARDGEQAVVQVSDTGVGIAADVLPTVWDMFAQVRDTIAKAQGGLGIGLALTRTLVEMHGGTVAAESPGLGRGSTFTLRLPLAIAAGAAAAQRAVAEATARQVLVVDDNVDGAETLGMLLEISGHTARCVHTGPDALAAIREHAPDLVFLDIGLPGMDGYEVARRLRASHVNVVLVALTGWGSAADKQKSRDAGFDFHLTKPVTMAMINDVFAQLLPERDASGAR